MIALAVCFLVGLALGTFLTDRRWSRLRMKYFWLRPPHRGE